MKKIFLALSTVLLLSGCNTPTTTGDSARTAISTFDGAKTVSVGLHPIVCANVITNCAFIGFAWNDKNPNQVSSLIKISDIADYHAISAVKFNIDGDIVTLNTNLSDSNQFEQLSSGSKETTKQYVVPLSLLERIKSSTSTKVQIIGKGTVIEGDFKNSGESTKAYYAMLRFLDEVKVNK